jgi:methanogenic corrinoid protein MtbC1
MNLAAFRVHLDLDYERSLSKLIEGEIIPRLMVAHASESAQPAAIVTSTVITREEVEAFAPLVIQVEADLLLHHVEAILARGIPFESVLVDLLAPTARMLGAFWDTDQCDFVDVTMGLWRLQEIVHEMSGRLRAEHPVTPGSRRALFAPMPGDQHSFGTIMIDDIFRREGWLTERLTEAETADLLHYAESEWYDIIGLTVSCDCHIAHLRSTIAALRDVSKNPQVCVMVGGRIFSADPDLAEHVGADGTAGDAKSAPRVAYELVRERERSVAP